METDLSPYFPALRTVEFFIIGDVTWKEERQALTDRAEQYRRHDFNDLLTVFCTQYGLRRRVLAYYLAREFGMSKLRPHYHFLIARHGLEHLSACDCAQTLQELWQSRMKPRYRGTYGIGNAKIEPYQKSQGDRGIRYCCKLERDDFYNPIEKSEYISPRLLNLLRRN